ncbi:MULTISPECIES: cellulase family glycosylhydrolase [Catenuloplanes]|uniref:Endoglucanase n=1 Tax=Catenuloplanes niger TaxID=587534 RepID=A0AAE3ZYS3_9ACTN|nr:cellulase family glycosylhydrolase [Catenuloplanes niger]MDR7327437.1 endoglucanase [Catenuloplanes niger]
MPPPSRRLAVIIGTLTALLAAGPAAATGAHAATGCRVAHTVPSRCPGGATADVAVTGLGPADPMATVAAMEPGWNLGNTLDAIPDETAWGNPLTTRELLRHVRAQGYRSIRLPVTWSNHHGPAPDHTIDAAWLARVRQIVDWSLDEGLYVMVNLHHDSWQWLNVTPTDTARYTALWSQIAAEFRDHSSKLVFESINEPQFTGTADDAENYRVLAGLNATFVDLVRASGGGNATRLLVLPTLHTNADQGRLDALLAEIDALDDPYLAATVHFYGYWPFSVNIAGGIRYDATVEADLVGTFDRVHDTFVARGIPVVIGEWALLNWDHNRPGVIERGEFLKFLEAVGHHARARQLTTMLWDAGQFLDRTTLTWRDQGVHDMLRASWTTRSGTASADRVYLPRTGRITARSLTLHPNGLTFAGLTGLRAGTDYTVAGTTLTLTAAALTRLAGDRAYGVNRSIEARFSAGVPWRIDIITADPPVQSAATGGTTSFAIPTRFRGDQLATMEARYADGSPAGPANWTSYKEFWQHFRPDYATGRILLTPEFFAEVTDGPVTLTFHFWSGARTTYRLVRSGTSITGSPA